MLIEAKPFEFKKLLILGNKRKLVRLSLARDGMKSELELEMQMKMNGCPICYMVDVTFYTALYKAFNTQPQIKIAMNKRAHQRIYFRLGIFQFF